jgi:hypothetical protein
MKLRIGCICALVLLGACRDQQDAGRLKDAVSDSGVEPVWTREAPHYFVRDGLRYASAVGRARVGNLSLSRAAAQDRARVSLLRLLRDDSSDALVSGFLQGARITDSFDATNGGETFIRVEVNAPVSRGRGRQEPGPF